MMLAGWATVALTTTHLLHLDSSGRPVKTFFARAAFINTVTFGVPACFVASTVVLGVNAQRQYRVASGAFTPLASAVAQAAQSL